jgi:excisionase family DNA binding protein
MRAQAADSMIEQRGEDLLTTGEAARILSTSRQHIVDLCDRGDLPFVSTGTHRRIRRADLEALSDRTRRLTRDQLRSLWLGHATAGKLVEDPPGAMTLARRNLESLKRGNPRGSSRRWLDEWERLLDGAVDDVLVALTSRAPRFRELRQNSPFAGVLSDDERRRVLAAFKGTHAPRAGDEPK